MKQIAIRLDTGPSIGLGHLMRCLSLAEVLTETHRVSVFFVCRNRLPQEIPYEVRYLKQGIMAPAEGYQVSGIEDEVEEMRQVLHDRHIDCLIVDHYGAGDAYFEALRDQVPCLVCIDDGMKRTVSADIVVNGNLYGEKADYRAVPVQLLGGTYTLLRKEFQDLPARRIRSRLQNVYITSGGADPLRFCEKILQAAEYRFPELCFHIIAGANFEPEYVAALENHAATVHKNADMSECMLDADLFITAGGSTLYELAATGTPSISYILAEDQTKVAESVWSRHCSLGGGRFSEFQLQELIAAMEKLKDPRLRQRLSRAGRKTVSSAGAAHTAQKIMELMEQTAGDRTDTGQLSLIPVKEHHMDLLFSWANERETRKYAFQQGTIPYSTHKKWLKQKLNSDHTSMFICTYGDQNIGQVRVDHFAQNGELDYSIDSAWRGKGFAKQMLALLAETLSQQHELKRLTARVKYENIPSQKVLEALGYEKQNLPDFIEYCKVLV